LVKPHSSDGRRNSKGRVTIRVCRLCYIISIFQPVTQGHTHVSTNRPNRSPTSDPIGFLAHDHRTCIKAGLANAETHCATSNLQLTPVRRRVLEILLAEHKALGAYELLARLDDEGLGSQPPVIYRALDFLLTHGFVHKVEQLNAFVACNHPGGSHTPAFMICTECHGVVEMRTVAARGALGSAAKQSGFRIQHTVVEAAGVCASCDGPGA